MEHLAIWIQLYRYCTIKQAEEQASVLKELSRLETFKERVDYAEKEMKHLSSGSSRVIYVMSDGVVLKLAKNKKGLAQNKVEANPEIKSKYINKTLQNDKDGIWIVAPFLDDMSEKEFEKLTGINFKDFGEALSYGLQDVAGDSEKKPKGFSEIAKSEIYKELVEVGKKWEIMPGDLERISSWRRKGNTPIIADLGLSKEIFDQFYED